MGICIISVEERGRLINYSLPPVCTQHRHCSFKSALSKAASGLWEIVTSPLDSSIQYLTEVPMHFLAVKKSGNIGVVQRVKKAQPRHIERIEFGDDDTSPLKRVKQVGLSVGAIRKREPEFRAEQLMERGSAIRSNEQLEKSWHSSITSQSKSSKSATKASKQSVIKRSPNMRTAKKASSKS